MKLEQASLSWLNNWQNWIHEEPDSAWDGYVCRQIIEQRLRREIFSPLPSPPASPDQPASPGVVENYFMALADDLRSSKMP
jgi:hypothetical protein